MASGFFFVFVFLCLALTGIEQIYKLQEKRLNLYHEKQEEKNSESGNCYQNKGCCKRIVVSRKGKRNELAADKNKPYEPVSFALSLCSD